MDSRGRRTFAWAAWLAAAVAVMSTAASAGAAERPSPLFPAFAAARVDARLPLPQWETTIAALRRDGERLDACQADPGCADRPARRLLDLFDRLAASQRAEQIAAVNAYVNAVPYVTDAAKFGREDVWQAPLAFLEGAGDCEDFVIAKYFALRRLGMADDDLRIIVYLERDRVIHAVLAATVDGRTAILDNRSPRLGTPADYPAAIPKYAINATHRWVFVAVGEGMGGSNRAAGEIFMNPAAQPGG